MLERLGRGAATHRRWVLACWFIALLALGTLAGALGGTTNDVFRIPGTDSQRAFDILEAEFPGQNQPTGTLVFLAPDGESVTSPNNADAIEAALANVAKLDHLVPGTPTAPNPTNPFATSEGVAKAEESLGIDAKGAAGVSRNERLATSTVTYDVDPVRTVNELGPDAFDDLDDALEPARKAGLETKIGGTIADLYDVGGGGIAGHADELGLIIAAIILIIAFGSIVAAGMPITVALIGLGVGLSLVTVLEKFTTIGSVAPILGTMIGLGVGIDYSLFIVTRYRENLALGMEPIPAIGNAIGTAGSAVLFAGITVCIATLGLFIAGIPYVTTLGWVAALVVAIIVLAALTLLPAILGFAGKNVNAWHVPGLGKGSTGGSPMWAKWAKTVGRFPWLFGILAIVLLVALAFPFKDMQLGFPDDGTAPPGTQQRAAYDLISEHFGPGEAAQLVVTISLPDGTTATDADALSGIVTFSKTVAAADNVSLVLPVASKSGNTFLVAITPETASDAVETKALVERLRDTIIPDAIKGTTIDRADVHVGGSTAVLIDLSERIQDRLPFFIGAVVLLSFVLLMMVFRSILIPLQAAVANLLSIGAAYGAVVYVFQKGYGKELIGLPETVPVVAFVPLMMFAILFGLSMDYEVFLMSRIREEWLKTKDYRDAISTGISMTARVITSAALIMIAVFLAFVTNDQPAVKMMGFGLAVAVLVDATIVRLLFVPATLELMGKAAWWFPDWLDRILPKIELEGAAPTAASAPEVDDTDPGSDPDAGKVLTNT